MDIVELFIDENDEVSGIEAISVVENPAIEENFIALKNQEFKLAEVDKEKRILMGAALIPNKPIYRTNGEQEYYIYFSQATVRKASELFFIKGNQNNSTLEHQLELKGLTAVESWIVESEQDKSRMYDLNVPIGTWMVSMKVNNDDVWKKVKAGEVKGFSIEGYFADKLERPNEPVKDEMKEPCEAGYEMIGTKIKNGKKVPNCVPIKQSKMSKEEIAEAKIEELKQLFSTQKIELGVIQEVSKILSDAPKRISEANRIQSNMQSLYTKLNNVLDDKKSLKSQLSNFESILNGVMFIIDEGGKLIDKIEIQSKELGIKTNEIKGYSELNKKILETKDLVKKLNTSEKAANNILRDLKS